MSTKRKTKRTPKKHASSSVIWFEIPADNVQRAKNFYGKLFGWKINKFSGMSDYWHIDTGGSDDSPDGGMMPRVGPKGIVNYISAPSLDKAAAQVKKLGGEICKPRTAVPQMGYFVICQDTEENMFALWEMDREAK